MPPELITTVALAMIALQCETELDWHVHGERPLAISRIGLIGELILLVARWAVIVAGLSLIVWSFVELPWYFAIALLLGIPAVVRAISRPEAIRKWLTSALTPPLTATSLIALHWLTWFA